MSKPQILKEDQISNVTQIINEPQICKKSQISKETQITSNPKNLKDRQISKKKNILQMNPKFPKLPNLLTNHRF